MSNEWIDHSDDCACPDCLAIDSAVAGLEITGEDVPMFISLELTRRLTVAGRPDLAMELGALFAQLTLDDLIQLLHRLIGESEEES
jgi:hypothetical protein